MDFLQRTPFFRLLVSLVCGIVVFQYLELYLLTKFIILISAVIFILSSLLLTKSRHVYLYRWLFGSGITLLLFLAGYFVAGYKAKEAAFVSPETSGIFRIEVMESPVEKPKSVSCRVRVNRFYDGVQMVKIASPSLIYFAKDSLSLHLKKGDILMLRTTFQEPSKALNPEGFDYATYLKRKGITVTAYVNSGNWKIISHINRFSLKSLAEASRNKLLELYSSVDLEKDQFAVLSALTLGYQDDIDKEVREDYSFSGATHILSVSGLHVGVIYIILNFILSRIFRDPKWKILNTVFIVGFLWIYAFITGLPPSVIRSATMFSLVAIGAAIGRKSQIYNTISVSAFFILLFFPDYLFDVGFQLSYLAVISIVYFQPKISSLVYVKNKPLSWLWDLTAVSLAAQLGTLPLALYYFSQFPNYFLFSNYLAIPLSSLIIYFSVAFLFFSWIMWVKMGLAFLLKYLLWMLNWAVAWIHDLPHAISIFHINAWQMLLLFISLLLASFYFENKKFGSLSACLFCFLLFMITDMVLHFQTLQKDQIVVYADRKQTHINFISGKYHQLMTTDSVAAKLTAGRFWRSRKLYSPDFKMLNGSCFKQFMGKRCLILQDNLLHRKQSERPLKVDLLIIGNSLKPRSEELFTCVEPELCVVDQTISTWYVEKLRESCRKRNIQFYAVSAEGAYIYNFKPQ